MSGRPCAFTVLAALTVLAAGAVLSGCGTSRDVSIPTADQIAKPTFATLPADLADSPQLTALVGRDTAGLESSSPPARAELLPEALAALAALPDPPRTLSRLTIYSDSVYFTYPQGGVTGRSVSYIYRPGGQPTVSDPTYNTDPAYPISLIDAAVPAKLLSAIEARVPNARITEMDLEVALSYDFGLVWHISVEDARGTLATVFADLDGAIVAVDQS